ncbi:hypothetical protein [Ensifer sp. Root127]|uniref:hypothetical protein n=1 Tax=Ensifer sp. Root127 TaxID=1736440 RepID=UPI000709CDD6|nr:hypothetical protein [Ensifer sp. Root127]KQW82032.1 hypothetical protein ASD03_23215 [Ensifer sp. Root127]
MNFVEATTTGINTGSNPAWVDFGDFATMVIFPVMGRTEANQLAYFNRTEIGCIYESEVSDQYPIVIPLPPNRRWNEIRLSMFGRDSDKIPAFTAALIYGRDQIEGTEGMQSLTASFEEIQAALLAAPNGSIDPESDGGLNKPAAPTLLGEMGLFGERRPFLDNYNDFVDATTSGIHSCGPSWIDFGDFRTTIILPSLGRTEAKQLAYFSRTEIGCIHESELSDKYPIVVPLPPDCLWEEIRVSMFGWYSRRIPAFTAALIHGDEQVDGSLPPLETAFEEIQTSLLEAAHLSIHDEEAYRADRLLEVTIEIEDCLKWLEENKHIDLEGWTLRLSRDGIEISPRWTAPHWGCSEVEFGPDCTVEHIIAAIHDHIASLEQYLFYFYANREMPTDSSFMDKIETYAASDDSVSLQ